MKKLINDADRVVHEALSGVARVTEGAAFVDGHHVLVRADREAGRVAVLSGGGSGHEPAFSGYLGPGHLDGAVCGEVFASPGVDAVLAGIRAVDDPALLVVMNYTGDRLNFGLAAQLARAEGRECAMVTVADDVALDADDDVTAGRRGLAGTVLVTKVAGAAAGLSVALLPVDDERLGLIDAPARSAGWPSGSGRLSGPASEPVPTVDVPEDEHVVSGDGSGRLRGTVELVCRAVREAEDHLTELDAATGDGDLGTSLTRGATRVLDGLDTADLDDPVATLRSVAASVRRAIGGTSGPLLATALLHAAEHLDAGGAPDEVLRAAADGIADLGGARRGDRTLLDALYPAADELASSGSLSAAAEAAADGAEATAEMTPRRGRSSYLGERAHGHPEAVVVVLRALAEA